MLNLRALALLSLAPALLPAAAPQPDPPPALLDQLRARHDGIALWWMGNAGWLIKSGDVLAAIDLDLETAGKVQPPPVTAVDLAPLLDAAFVTHHHGDHCNLPTLGTFARDGRCAFVLPRTCVPRVARLNIPAARIVVPEPGHPFVVAGLRIEPLHAIHGNQEFTVLTREPDFVDSIAHSCGYVFSTGGKRLFHPGDSVLTEEHLALQNIDVLFVSPTVHNMYIDRSQILIERLRPAYIFPQHFGTYRQTEANAFWTRGYPDELAARLPAELRARYHRLRPGEMFVIR